ncbi:MAG TPA: lamin tail domain-containing protein, partial [Chitinophagaceae bacterium]|nr:lamin tail domain-containing protein [Chitinophagaceae bacterium]
MKKIFTACFILFSLITFSQSTTVVISQVYPGGGSSSPTVTYKNDYVELHNISSVVQDISGFSLQYGSATGNFGSSGTQIFAIPAGTTIPAGGYLLIQLGTAGTGGANLPVTPDLSSTNLSMGAASGKVALVNNSTPLGCGA